MIYKCSCFTITLSRLRAALLLTGTVPTALPEGAATSPLLQCSSLCHMPYDWPGELSWFGVDGLVLMLFSLPLLPCAFPRVAVPVTGARWGWERCRRRAGILILAVALLYADCK